MTGRIRDAGRRALRLLLVLVLLPVGALLLCLLFLPWPLSLRWKDPDQTSFMEYRVREARNEGEKLAIRQSWVPLDRISPDLRRAVLVAEDDRFYLHHGIDWKALGEETHYTGDTVFSWWSLDDLRSLEESLAYAWAHRSEVKGRSTLTQQLAKNLYFTPERSLARKLAEAVVAKRLELFLPKDRILELYLNVAEWGPGIFGAEAAAEAYFDGGADDLTLEQAAALAATLPHPLTSNPAFRPSRMAWRKEMLLHRMRARPPPAPPLVTVPLLPDTASAGATRIDDTKDGADAHTTAGEPVSSGRIQRTQDLQQPSH
jgi:monofunctional biosynthetic peptidoglycan transglycosylase